MSSNKSNSNTYITHWIYSKSRSAKPDEVLSMDLAISKEYNSSLKSIFPAIKRVCDIFYVSLLEYNY